PAAGKRDHQLDRPQGPDSEKARLKTKKPRQRLGFFTITTEVSPPLLIKLFEAEVGRLHIPFSTTTIKAPPLEFIGKHTAPLGLFHEGIGNLDLAALARFGLGNQLKDIGRQDVAADD